MAILKKLLGLGKVPEKTSGSQPWPVEASVERPPIRVLLVDDDKEDYMLTRDVLDDVREQEFDLYWAQDYEEAVSAIRSGSFDVYLLDYKLGARTGIDLLRDELGSGTKGAAVILTGVRDRDIDMEAMRCGASGYLVKSEAGPTEMERAIRYAIEGYRAKLELAGTRRESSGSRVISFIGAKGGSGTTSTAVNVGVALAEMGRSVCALDLCPGFGTLAWQLGLEGHKDLSDLLELAAPQINGETLEACSMKHVSGIRVLASPQEPERYGAIDPLHARAIIGAAESTHEFVIVDLPNDPSEANRTVLGESDIVGLVMDREPASLAAAKRWSTMLHSWSPQSLAGVVVIDRIVAAAGESATWIAASVNLELFRYIAAAKEVFADAAANQIPVVSSARSHFAAQAFVELASKLATVGLKARAGAARV